MVRWTSHYWRRANSTILGVTVLMAVSACDENRYAGDPVASLAAATQAYTGRPPIESPDDNPLTVGKIDLGRKLFHDPRLSVDGSVSCASCHVPAQGYTQNSVAVATGVGGLIGARNSPSLYDVGYRPTLFHDGRVASLEAQYVEPMLDQKEMANPSMDEVVVRLRGYADYENFFLHAFSGTISHETIGKALAAYQRTLVTGPNDFDLWRDGSDDDALNDIEIAGYRLFTGKANCATCHTADRDWARFTDDRFHDTGYARLRAAQRDDGGDLGRGRITGSADDAYAFRTPSLRNVALTGPYMHDGAVESLGRVLEIMSEGENLGAHAGGTPLSEQERQFLVAFLEALTSETRP